jgi:hypothetical protein
MSAAATAEAVPVSDAIPVHAVPTQGPSTFEIEAAEQKRWMTWFGIPALVAAIFLGLTFGTGDAWWLGLAITAIVFDILVLVWLAMSSDTNGALGEPSSGH